LSPHLLASARSETTNTKDSARRPEAMLLIDGILSSLAELREAVRSDLAVSEGNLVDGSS
jgi:hypothetical protein